jgi:CRP-like cAMP-binding protein
MGGPTELHKERNQLIRKLESIATLSDEDRRAIFGLPVNSRHFAADQDIVREGDRPSECGLIVEGFACSYKHSAEGRRQIMSVGVARCCTFTGAGESPSDRIS